MIDAPPTGAECDKMIDADRRDHEAKVCNRETCIFCEGIRETALEYRLLFGKHEGERITEVPKPYLRWLLSQQPTGQTFGQAQLMARTILGDQAASKVARRPEANKKRAKKQRRRNKRMKWESKRDKAIHAMECDTEETVRGSGAPASLLAGSTR